MWKVAILAIIVLLWSVPSVQAPAAEKGERQITYSTKTVGQPSIIKEYEKYNGRHGGQCVEWIQSIFDSYGTHEEFRGRAGDIQPNTTQARVGGVVITTEGYLGHVALIVEIRDKTLVLAESNFGNSERVSVGRELQMDSERIVGYFNF